MLILFGEKIITSTENLGEFDCPICSTQKEIIHIVEKSYFTVFFLRILPLDTVADYRQCSGCGHAFDSSNMEEPQYFSSVRAVLAYLLAGFGVYHGIDASKRIFNVVTNKDACSAEIQRQMRNFEQGQDLFEQLKQDAKTLSWFDKSLIVEAAFLLVYAARPIEYEERLRVNLIGNALGVGIEGVNAIIKNLQSQQYKGIRSMEIENA